MSSIDWERYFFRLMKQGEDEPLISFYERLRNQTESCNFLDTEAQLKDQILQKCLYNELREKAFVKEMSLQQLLLTGETIEEAKKNCTNGQGSSSSNQKVLRERRENCTRCGSKDLFHSKRSCPAFVKNILCGNCQRRGHFHDFCRLPKKCGNKRKLSISEDLDEKSREKVKRMNSSQPHPKSQQSSCETNPSLLEGKHSNQPKEASAIATKNEKVEANKSPSDATSSPENGEKQRTINVKPLIKPKETPSTNDRMKGLPKIMSLLSPSAATSVPKSALKDGKQTSVKKVGFNLQQSPARALDLPLSDNKPQSKPRESPKANDDKAEATGIKILKIESIYTSSSGMIVGNQIPKIENSKVDSISTPNVGILKSDGLINHQVSSTANASPRNNSSISAAPVAESSNPQIKMLQQSYDCLIGLQPYSVRINTESSLNIISQSLLNKLLIDRSEVLTQSAMPLSIKNYKFCGTITTTVYIRSKMNYVHFYIQKSDQDYVLINKEMAVKFGLLHT